MISIKSLDDNRRQIRETSLIAFLYYMYEIVDFISFSCDSV